MKHSARAAEKSGLRYFHFDNSFDNSFDNINYRKGI